MRPKHAEGMANSVELQKLKTSVSWDGDMESEYASSMIQDFVYDNDPNFFGQTDLGKQCS